MSDLLADYVSVWSRWDDAPAMRRKPLRARRQETRAGVQAPVTLDEETGTDTDGTLPVSVPVDETPAAELVPVADDDVGTPVPAKGSPVRRKGDRPSSPTLTP